MQVHATKGNFPERLIQFLPRSVTPAQPTYGGRHGTYRNPGTWNTRGGLGLRLHQRPRCREIARQRRTPLFAVTRRDRTAPARRAQLTRAATRSQGGAASLGAPPHLNQTRSLKLDFAIRCRRVLQFLRGLAPDDNIAVRQNLGRMIGAQIAHLIHQATQRRAHLLDKLAQRRLHLLRAVLKLFQRRAHLAADTFPEQTRALFHERAALVFGLLREGGTGEGKSKGKDQWPVCHEFHITPPDEDFKITTRYPASVGNDPTPSAAHRASAACPSSPGRRTDARYARPDAAPSDRVKSGHNPAAPAYNVSDRAGRTARCCAPPRSSASAPRAHADQKGIAPRHSPRPR